MQIPKNFTRAIMDGHGLIGVLFGAVVYVLCLTGALLVLVDQLTVWERPDAPTVAAIHAEDIPNLAQRAVATAKAAGMGHDVYLRLPNEELPRATVFATDGKGSHRDWDIDTAGKLGPHTETPWLEFVQTLHFNLTIPGAIGRYVVGLFGTLLMASIVTGLLAHRRILKDAFRLRWGGTRRLANADLHNRIGVWARPFHLIVALTGSLLGLAGLITIILALVAYKGDQEKALVSLLGPQAVEDSRPAPLPDMPRMLAGIERVAPGAEIQQIAYEHAGTRGQQVRFFIAAPGHLTRSEAFLFDGTGRLVWRAGLTDGNVGMRIYGMITPLHYGTYGGVPLKIIYAILGAGLTLIVATGGNVWLARRREQGRATPRLERLWAALLWGQPLVLVTLAIVSAIATAPFLPIYWVSTTLLWAAALLLPSGDAVRRHLQFALIVALLTLSTGHLFLRGNWQSTAIWVDIALFAGATGVVIGKRNRMRTEVGDSKIASGARHLP